MSNEFIIKNKKYNKESEEIKDTNNNLKKNDELVYYKRISFYENFYESDNSNINSIYVPLSFYYDKNNIILNFTPNISSITLNTNNAPIKIYDINDTNDPYYPIWNELTSKPINLTNMIGNNVPNYNYNS